MASAAHHRISANPRAPGAWKLAPGRALTLSPRQAGLLEVVYGEVWATFDGPHAARSTIWETTLSRAGERLVPRGRTAPGGRVLAPDAPAFFSWDPCRGVRRQRAQLSAS